MQPEQQQRIMGYFIEEAKDHLTTIEQGLLNLQSTIEDSEMANELFRAAHSVKGGAAMLGLNHIQRVSHRLEDFFKLLKETPVKVDRSLESLFLRVFDALQELLGQLQGPYGPDDAAARTIVAGVEPVFEELEQHLNQLAGSAAVPLSSGQDLSGASVTAFTSSSQPEPQEDAFVTLFQQNIPARLREMLQLFKQSDADPSIRQQLQDICHTLSSLGEQHYLPGWCHLVETARQAIANLDNSYRLLAPIVIKDIKQAQELVLSGRADEIMPCSQLQELVPLPILLEDTELGVTEDFSDFLVDQSVAEPFASSEYADNASIELPFDVFQTTVSQTGTFSGETFEDISGLDLAGHTGPEVGMAELNSLADLFEGEVPDLGSTWQEEEIVSDVSGIFGESSGESSNESATNDFSDLLFETNTVADRETTHGGLDDDFGDLFEDALPEDEPYDLELAETSPLSTASLDSAFGDTDDLDALLAISGEESPSHSDLAQSDSAQSALEDWDDLGLNDQLVDHLGLSNVSDLELGQSTGSASSSFNNLGEWFDGMDEDDFTVAHSSDHLGDSFSSPEEPPFSPEQTTSNHLPTESAEDPLLVDPWDDGSLAMPADNLMPQLPVETTSEVQSGSSVDSWLDNPDLSSLLTDDSIPSESFEELTVQDEPDFSSLFDSPAATRNQDQSFGFELGLEELTDEEFDLSPEAWLDGSETALEPVTPGFDVFSQNALEPTVDHSAAIAQDELFSTDISNPWENDSDLLQFDSLDAANFSQPDVPTSGTHFDFAEIGLEELSLDDEGTPDLSLEDSLLEDQNLADWIGDGATSSQNISGDESVETDAAFLQFTLDEEPSLNLEESAVGDNITPPSSGGVDLDFSDFNFEEDLTDSSFVDVVEPSLAEEFGEFSLADEVIDRDSVGMTEPIDLDLGLPDFGLDSQEQASCQSESLFDQVDQVDQGLGDLLNEVPSEVNAAEQFELTQAVDSLPGQAFTEEFGMDLFDTPSNEDLTGMGLFDTPSNEDLTGMGLFDTPSNEDLIDGFLPLDELNVMEPSSSDALPHSSEAIDDFNTLEFASLDTSSGSSSSANADSDFSTDFGGLFEESSDQDDVLLSDDLWGLDSSVDGNSEGGSETLDVNADRFNLDELQSSEVVSTSTDISLEFGDALAASEESFDFGDRDDILGLGDLGQADTSEVLSFTETDFGSSDFFSLDETEPAVSSESFEFEDSLNLDNELLELSGVNNVSGSDISGDFEISSGFENSLAENDFSLDFAGFELNELVDEANVPISDAEEEGGMNDFNLFMEGFDSDASSEAGLDDLGLDGISVDDARESFTDLEYSLGGETTPGSAQDFTDMDNLLGSESAAGNDDFADLADLLTEGIASTGSDSLAAAAPSASPDDFSDLEGFLGSEAADSNDFLDLENLLDGDSSGTGGGFGALAAGAIAGAALGSRSLPTASENDLSELEALLEGQPSESQSFQSQQTASTFTANKGSEFDELDDLLKDAEEKMGGSPTVKSARGAVSQNRRAPRPGKVFSEQTMRVPVKHLDNLSNLVGELVVNRNSLEQDQERLRQSLDNLLYQVQQLSDVGQRMQDLYERSLLESSLLASRKNHNFFSNISYLGESAASTQTVSSSDVVEYDPLEMDRFTGFHSLSQEMIELIVRVRESASDIEFIVDETDQVTRMFRQVTTQLQEGLTRSRMVPFAQTADRLPRAVRDISMKVGKQAELQIEGRETLIDKMILEQLYDPMTHLVNNAISHGIESPETRRAAGKPAVGRITIRAFHQGNQTIISVSDDGAGIDVERVKEKAIAKKLLTAEEARGLSRLETYDLLFHPGFSTAEVVNDFQGRGVGMDVVLTSLSEIRGVINTDSSLGKGTTFTIRLPLTLSISKALCCISDRARIAFPMDGVEDMLDVPKERVQMNAEGQPCISWRDSLLPLRPLTELLAYNRHLSRGSVYGGNQEDDITSIVVLRSAGNFLALQVDQVLGEQEIVIKQLEGPIPKPMGVAGATVLGDGRIMPIADVLELIDLSVGRIRKEASGSLWDQSGSKVPQEPVVIKTEPTVLIVDDSITVRELLSMTFNKVGYRVEQARDGQEAWEKLRAGLPCDIVFCDIEMPRMDGLELLSRIQKDPNLNLLPIAMLTSRGADRHRQMASSLGASGYFTKPYLEEGLLDAAQRMLKGEKLL